MVNVWCLDEEERAKLRALNCLDSAITCCREEARAPGASDNGKLSESRLRWRIPSEFPCYEDCRNLCIHKHPESNLSQLLQHLPKPVQTSVPSSSQFLSTLPVV